MTTSAPKKIAIIEDNIDYEQLLERVLTKAGYIVKGFYEPTAGLQYLKAEKPDILILDIMLPTISGFQVLEEIKRSPETDKIAVFCLTNLPEEVGREKALALGAYCYLTKTHYNIYDILKHVDFFFSEEGKSKEDIQG